MTPTEYRFTGQRHELAGVYLVDYGARWYKPWIGRFIQPDTIVPEPGNPQTLNRYSYGLNNPLKYVDPTGHRSSCAGRPDCTGDHGWGRGTPVATKPRASVKLEPGLPTSSKKSSPPAPSQAPSRPPSPGPSPGGGRRGESERRHGGGGDGDIGLSLSPAAFVASGTVTQSYYFRNPAGPDYYSYDVGGPEIDYAYAYSNNPPAYWMGVLQVGGEITSWFVPLSGPNTPNIYLSAQYNYYRDYFTISSAAITNATASQLYVAEIDVRLAVVPLGEAYPVNIFVQPGEGLHVDLAKPSVSMMCWTPSAYNLV